MIDAVTNIGNWAQACQFLCFPAASALDYQGESIYILYRILRV